MSRAKRLKMIQRRRIQRNRRAASIFAMVLMSLSISILCHNFGAQAEQQPTAYKYYTDVRVGSGDTLWGIAMEYMTDEYKNVNEYIREIKELNHIGTSLQYGQLLTVPYYSDEFK